jgi:hypothetical protein
MKKLLHTLPLLLLACLGFTGDLAIGQPDPYISNAAWAGQRSVARKLGATWFRIVLGTKELKDAAADRLSAWGKRELDRVLLPLKKEGFSLHVTLAGSDFGCLAEIVANLKGRGMKVQIDPCNEDPAFQKGKPYTSYLTRMKWLQTQLAGTDIGAITGINHGWFGDWIPALNKTADTADFGIELQRQLNQVDYIYAPGSELRAVNGYASFGTNCYVSWDCWNVREALIQKARSIDTAVHTYYNKNQIVLAEFGVWLPPYDGNNAYLMALGVGSAARVVRAWPGIARVTIYAPAGDPHYGLVLADGTEVGTRVYGYRAGLMALR